jgi:lipopolysaccharide biosynthesis regulator YciM
VPPFRSLFRRARRDGARGSGSREERLLETVQAILDRDFDVAEEALRALAEEDSERVGPMLALASLYRTRGEVGRAIRIHQNLMLRPDCSRKERVAALRGVAEDFRQGGFLQRAIAAYEELRQESPRDAGVYRALCELYAKLKDFRRALEARRRLPRDTRDAPSEAQLHLEWAQLHMARGEDEDGARALRKALKRDPELAAGWEALGDLEASRGRRKKARAAWERALALDTRHARALLTKLEAAYAEDDRLHDFDALLAARLEANASDVDAALARVRLAWHSGDQAVAVARLDKILKEFPHQLEALAWRARVVAGEHAPPEAAAAWDAVTQALAEEGRFERRERLV